jgi:hypothetical protein
LGPENVPPNKTNANAFNDNHEKQRRRIAMGNAKRRGVFQLWIALCFVFLGFPSLGCFGQGADEMRVASGDSLRQDNWQVRSLEDGAQEDWLSWIASKQTKGKSSSSSWWPSWGSTKKKPTSSPTIRSYSTNNKTTYEKMTASAKEAWKKTTDFLDPYPDPKPKTVVAPTKKKSSWFGGSDEDGSWWGKEEKKKQSVPDFLGQEMPK